MKKIKIITDSTVALAPGIAEELDITIVPLSIMIDGTIYSDDQLSGEEFMKLMAEAHELPKTSQPPIGLFLETYDQFADEDTQVLSIHVAQMLSGTPEAARQAANMSKADVVAIDSGFVDQALGFQVVKAAQMAKEGATREEILATLEEIKMHTTLFIGISTLDNLVKGGRIGRTKGMISSFLNIKAVLEMTLAGSLDPVAKGRGTKTFVKWFNEMKETLVNGPTLAAIGISHADNLAFANQMATQLREMFPNIPVTVLHTASAVATHTGPGAFALEFYTKA
ncbi:MAG: DegV family protein [Streptococcaceae bacterium]|jgi:DegV family protein with EDD domain|nr:DegV family protein [Streptococcaceae bacterium]